MTPYWMLEPMDHVSQLTPQLCRLLYTIAISNSHSLTPEINRSQSPKVRPKEASQQCLKWKVDATWSEQWCLLPLVVSDNHQVHLFCEDECESRNVQGYNGTSETWPLADMSDDSSLTKKTPSHKDPCSIDIALAQCVSLRFMNWFCLHLRVESK